MTREDQLTIAAQIDSQITVEHDVIAAPAGRWAKRSCF